MQRLQIPARQGLARTTSSIGHNHQGRMLPRPRSSCTCSNRPGSARCSRHGYAIPAAEKLSRKYSANREILRRALTPPSRRITLRWFNFQPTPSRLSNMSMAESFI
ncbi:hypothetical protein Tsubulata_009928 [Turnera subulata]|uniref:Uncharacterized protein n=1 Tax=Turnera subulata TaxID=218843 RepID=A0A9Q0GDE7_9ROSI|nr:hypothetical protein Tsubulata_009928 [Turnera subulata]